MIDEASREAPFQVSVRPLTKREQSIEYALSDVHCTLAPPLGEKESFVVSNSAVRRFAADELMLLNAVEGTAVKHRIADDRTESPIFNFLFINTLLIIIIQNNIIY